MENEEFYTRDCVPQDLCTLRDIVNQHVAFGNQPMPYLEPVTTQPFFNMFQLCKIKKLPFMVFIEKKTEKLVGYFAMLPVNRFMHLGTDQIFDGTTYFWIESGSKGVLKLMFMSLTLKYAKIVMDNGYTSAYSLTTNPNYKKQQKVHEGRWTNTITRIKRAMNSKGDFHDFQWTNYHVGSYRIKNKEGEVTMDDVRKFFQPVKAKPKL